MASASSSPGAISPTQSAPDSTLGLAPSTSGQPRQTRIHFPTGADSASSKAASQFGLSDAPPHSLEPSSVHHQAPSVPGPSHDADFFDRRRVRSANAPDSLRPFGSYSRAQFLAGPSRPRTSAKRVVSLATHSSDQPHKKGPPSVGSSPLPSGVLLSPEKDEADQGDDPNILADLHKALQYKPHVEQHLKEARSLTDFLPPSLPSASTTSPLTASPAPYTAGSSLPRSEPNTPVKAEFVDFSPSVGKTSLHPVPTSTDDGATLDWSGSTDEGRHERKWTMSLARKSSKDKYPVLSRKALVERQDALYSEKLARIRDKVNELTLRKAEIARDQLQRRYAALNALYVSDRSHLNLANVARWFDKQENALKSLIVENEPMPWLRHLLRIHRHDQQVRQLPSTWYISALIVDEYLRSTSAAELISPFNVSVSDNASDVSSPRHPAIVRQATSRRTSFRSLDIGSARKSDVLLSFEPMTYSRRDSIGTDSHASVDAQLKRWHQSLLNQADLELSSGSSMRSRERTGSIEKGNVQKGRTSPVDSHSLLYNLRSKKRSHPKPLHSDEGRSSAAESMVNETKEDKQTRYLLKKESSQESRRSRFLLSIDLKSARPSLNDSRHHPGALSIDELRTDATQTSKSQSLPVSKERGTVTPAVPSAHDPTPTTQLASPIILNSVRKPDLKEAQRLSLPPSFQTPNARRRRSDTRSEARNHALQVEYTRKKELLDALVARNQHMKALLQVASRSVNDYDETQSIMAEKLGLSYQPLPPEVVEALKHDPSSSTGHLRNLKGWRAVEDIHLRRERQKEVLQSFTASLPESVTPLSLSGEGIYKGPITTLTNLVERLHNQRTTVLSHVRQTHELLSKVKKMRDELKPEFDEASKYTSVNYPELVQLESLLDEFANETNQLWRLAEASISFLLTSVAPLMKTFGRPVWDELHDFLVIPLYRNGFSGEDHWYPVSFPRRSIMHWFRLLLFASCAPFFLYHGALVFVALLTHGYVLRIPAVIPTFAVYFVFSGIMCAFASLLFGLFVGVLCENFIVLWWTLWLLRIVQ